jgi:hypothetical protein
MRTMRFVVFASLVMGACGDQPALSRQSPTPAGATLSPTIRQQLTTVFDTRAAEQFFQTMSQADADRVLADMGFYAGQTPAETEHVSVPMRSTDAATQAVLDRMWAPYWRQLPAGAAHAAALPYPGRPTTPAPTATEGVRP